MRRSVWVVVLAGLSAACASTTNAADAGRADVVHAADAIDVVDVGAADAIDVVEVGAADAGLCGDAACGSGQVCLRGRCAGCCDLPPQCVPIPSGCSGALACGCFTSDPCGACTHCGTVEADGIHCIDCQCMCAAPWTPIATPDGDRPIASLRVGDLVRSVDHGVEVVVPIARIHRTPVVGHAVVRVVLARGAVMEISGGHPTADGRRFDMLAPGDRLGDAVVSSVETVPYDEPFTYDILPASDSGTYFVSGAWVGSTLHGPAPRGE